MNLTIILLLNGFFLSLILASLLVVLSRFGHSQKIKKRDVGEDINKIKKQIVDAPL